MCVYVCISLSVCVCVILHFQHKLNKRPGKIKFDDKQQGTTNHLLLKFNDYFIWLTRILYSNCLLD